MAAEVVAQRSFALWTQVRRADMKLKLATLVIVERCCTVEDK